MSDADDRLSILVWHIRDVAAQVAKFVSGTTEAEVRSNLFLERGLVHSLYIVAALATRLQNEHPAFVASLPDVAWRDIRGLRNRIAHSYFEINHDVVWAAEVDELPVLSRLLMERLDDTPHTGT